jgi:hypothetical protein
VQTKGGSRRSIVQELGPEGEDNQALKGSVGMTKDGRYLGQLRKTGEIGRKGT